MVALPVSKWLGFFETLAFIKRESSSQEIYCTLAGGYAVFSQTPIKRRLDIKSDIKPEQIEN